MNNKTQPNPRTKAGMFDMPEYSSAGEAAAGTFSAIAPYAIGAGAVGALVTHVQAALKARKREKKLFSSDKEDRQQVVPVYLPGGKDKRASGQNTEGAIGEAWNAVTGAQKTSFAPPDNGKSPALSFATTIPAAVAAFGAGAVTYLVGNKLFKGVERRHDRKILEKAKDNYGRLVYEGVKRTKEAAGDDIMDEFIAGFADLMVEDDDSLRVKRANRAWRSATTNPYVGLIGGLSITAAVMGALSGYSDRTKMEENLDKYMRAKNQRRPLTTKFEVKTVEDGYPEPGRSKKANIAGYGLVSLSAARLAEDRERQRKMMMDRAEQMSQMEEERIQAEIKDNPVEQVDENTTVFRSQSGPQVVDLLDPAAVEAVRRNPQLLESIVSSSANVIRDDPDN